METKPLLKPDYFYNRSTRCWTLLWKDQNGNDDGVAEYFAGSDAKKRLLAVVKAEQPTKIDHSVKIDPNAPPVVITFTMHKQY